MSRLRVAVDARRWQDQPLGGVGRMLAHLLPLAAREVDMTLLTDARRGAVDTDMPQVAVPLPRWAPRPSPEPVWLERAVPRWLEGFDGIFHGTFNMLPARLPVPGVVTIHDASFEEHPEDFRVDKRVWWRWAVRRSARQASAWTTTSEFARRSLLAHYPIDPARLFLTPPAVDPVFLSSPSADGVARLGGFRIDDPYVVALAGAHRRGVEVAVAAWQQLQREGCEWSLVVVGNRSREQYPLGVVALGPLDDASWSAVLCGAEVFCYPTRYEGYGMPALEAAAAGTPVVCARVGALPEVLGDAAEWCEAATVDAITAGPRRLWTDEGRRRSLRTSGKARAARGPTWENSASRLVDAYRCAAAAGR